MVSLEDEELRSVEAHAPYGPPGGKPGKAGFAISARLQLVLRGRHEHRREHASRPQLRHDVESAATREHDVEDDAAIPSVERAIIGLGLDRAIAFLSERFA
jgi:hypothetical protein